MDRAKRLESARGRRIAAVRDARPRRFFAPEVIQTSPMDCGPAALKCLLDGHGIPVSYGRLREACQTSVDGTSIDTMEHIARQLGLRAEQVMLPLDHLLVPEANALPAILVVRLPNGFTHFVVVWRVIAGLVQIMDPARGRYWMSRARLLEEVYLHQMSVPAGAWRQWAGGEEFLAALKARLRTLGAGEFGNALVVRALADQGWRAMGALDGAARALEGIVDAGGLSRGAQARSVLEALFERALADADAGDGVVPASYWSVKPVSPQLVEREEQLSLRGAVLVRIKGRLRDAAVETAPEKGRSAPLSPELAAALSEPTRRPALDLLRAMRGDGSLTWSVFLLAAFAAAAATVFEGLMFRGLFDAGRRLVLPHQRAAAIAVVALFLLAITLLEFPAALIVRQFGRRLETQLRAAFLLKIPRLGLRYFHSRPTSDMAERAHVTHLLRQWPEVGARLLRAMLEICAISVGIIWLSPRSAPIVLLLALASLSAPLALQPALTERDMRVRVYAGALTRHYLDALRGLVAVRAHGAERAVRREHEALLVDWARAARHRLAAAMLAETLQAAVCLALGVWLVFDYVERSTGGGLTLLLVYWALALPTLGEEVAVLIRQYPRYRNVTLRLLEPLGALEERVAPPPAPKSRHMPDADPPRGVALRIHDVTVQAGGHDILTAIRVAIRPGEHVAIVGVSGAGKSSLVGLLLGWHRPSTGEVLVDGELLDGTVQDRLRGSTAWVDPAVQLWSRSVVENLVYGAPNGIADKLGAVVDDAELYGMLQRLPDGFQTSLGEGGALVSGGEGQRVRFGRALLRSDTRLVILDEPFRGLDREARRRLLARARHRWLLTTLLCITHDIGETLGFERVLVVEGGRIVEDGIPSELAECDGSRFASMLAVENSLRDSTWTGPGWRRFSIEDGRALSRDERAAQ